MGRLAYNMLSPGYLTQRKETAVDKELQRLYEATGEQAVLPSYSSKSFALPGEEGRVKMTGDEYTQYAKTRGQKAYAIFDSIIGGSGYKGLSSSEKAQAAQEVYRYATAIAKAEVSDYQLQDTCKKIRECEQSGIPAGVAIVAYIAQRDEVGDKDAKGKTVALSASRKKKAAIDQATPLLSEAQREQLYGLFGVSEKVW